MGTDSKPIRLVYYDDEEGMLRMDSEAVSMLQLLKGPIVVVSVCGPVQEGKSYIANQLVGRTSGFEVAVIAYPNRCTKGLWLWSSPSPKTAADGSTDYNLLVIDTEGINGCENAEQYFYLALVLSSTLIYNQMGLINWTSFDCLSVVPKMSDMFNVGDTTTAGLQQLSPILVCLLRDFDLDLKGMSPCEHMEYYLKAEVPVVARDAKFVISPNEVRKSIKDVFPERYCFTLVRPLNAEKKLCVLDQIPVDRLWKDFKKGVDELRSFVFEKTKPKKIGATTVMTGPIFVEITKYILEAFNSGKRPTIASIWENVEKTNRKSATTATLVGNPPAANTRQRKRSQDLAFTPI